MKKFSSRFGTTDDGEAIFEVMEKAFRVEKDSDKWHSWHRLAMKGAEHFRVLEVKGQIIAVALISQKRFYVGSCEIIHGDVGEVSVLPEFQGNGYGSALMTDVVQWMRDNGYDISRLGGYSIFYRRFGYALFPRRTIEFPIRSVHGGVRIISVEEMFRPPEGLPGEIRPYDASRDAIRRDELYQMFNKGRTGAIIRNFNPNAKMPTTPSAPDPLRIVYEANGVVEGYLFAGGSGETIHELVFNPSRPDAFTGVIKQILHVAAKNGVESITSRLPFDATILPILIQSTIAFELKESQGGYAGNMIQIVNLESLLRKVTPELESRLQASIMADSCCELAIGFGDQIVGLQIKDGRITSGVFVSDKATFMQTDQASLMKLIYGMLSLDEVPVMNLGKIGPVEMAVLRTLFPRQHTASGGWG
ncbi:GNAT family N-acetyltransferase [Candidatus Poribacteria bacterium]